MRKLKELARKFSSFDGNYDIDALGQGNINDTFLLRSCVSPFILQCINGRVFPQPQKVAENSAYVAAHVADFYGDFESKKFCRIIPALDGKNYVTAVDDTIWRAQTYIENSTVYQSINSEKTGFQVGDCLAKFHAAVEQLGGDSLEVTLPGFHFLPGYLAVFDDVLLKTERALSHTAKQLIMEVEKHRQRCTFFEDARRHGYVSQRIIHGDPKVSNILFSRVTNKALSMIDLDTVGPGFLLHDIGDCLRSVSCCYGESGHDKKSSCSIPLISSVLRGYFSSNQLTDFEIDSLFYALYLITFELGLRFLTDYLQNNCYFRVAYPEENLHRAMVQFNLVKSIVTQRSAIEKSVRKIVKNSNQPGRRK